MKTRDKLIEVARQLFARKGVEHTTMNDIAEASDKGRRTVYTYFANKREIYKAVVERESEQLVERLRAIAGDTSLSWGERLHGLLLAIVDTARDASRERGGLWSALFSLDFLGREERVRRLVRQKEEAIFRDVLEGGCRDGEFDPLQCRRLLQFTTVLGPGAYHVYREEVADRQQTPSSELRRLDAEAMAAFIVGAVSRRRDRERPAPQAD